MTVSPKNIIIIGPAHPLRGGLASFNERLATAFSQQGHQTSIYTFSLQYPGFLFPGTTQYSNEPAPKDLKIKACINSINPMNWLIIGRKLKKIRPDIIVVRYWLPFMGPCLGTILRIVKKNKHTRIVCIADNIIPHEKRAGDKIFTKYFIKPIDAFITMSEKVLLDLKNFKNDIQARFVPHPLYDNFGERVDKNEAREKLGIDKTLSIALFFGFIRKYKGLDILLDAIKIIKENKTIQTPVKFLVAGEFYEDRSPYDKKIAELGIQDMLILKTDFIPDSEVKYYLCAADLIVQPYRNATQSGVTPLAYHFEVPMIVTKVGGLPALVPDHKAGLVAEPDSEDIAQKIEDFFKIGAAHFIPYLRSEKIKYSWENMTEEILLLGGQTPRH
ncbi:MAG: glycosyltransferase [Ferruginibacter sp.]|nr:glycosyltransferase [Ferruginibacter sp.]